VQLIIFPVGQSTVLSQTNVPKLLHCTIIF